jgi:hypothetical protein
VDAITRALRRAFLKPNPHVQMLALAVRLPRAAH